MNDPNSQVIDKSVRSVFVGNIPYEATEEKLKDIFSEVGPVVSFKLVYDRENGKPKGYGFCEFKDQETALSAMRNLNGFEIAGRSLRVDNACTEKSRMEIQSLMQQDTTTESPYGAAVEPERAPETISKTVASLPPEQMFQLMQQMKVCIQNNPQEARTMLAQNPQLAYALLQAQVVMRIVDPETAVNMLHKAAPEVPPVGMPSRTPPVQPIAPPTVPPPAVAGIRPMGTGRPDLSDPMRLDGPPPSFNPESRPPPFGGDDRRDPRNRDPRERGSNGLPNVRNPPPAMGGGGPPPQLPSHLAGADPEKAQLIMQVLQLTDTQIAMLPPQQRESIMVLKEQINQGPR